MIVSFAEPWDIGWIVVFFNLSSSGYSVSASLSVGAPLEWHKAKSITTMIRERLFWTELCFFFEESLIRYYPCCQRQFKQNITAQNIKGAGTTEI